MENTFKNKVFGKYEIVNQLAVGGMGQIYLARQHDTYGIDRLVILKSLFPEMARDKECVKMFLDEARIASNLNHPNIVSIYEIGAWEGNYFLAMEYIRGEPLSTLVKHSLDLGEPVPIPFVISMMHDTCAALAYAHKATDIAGAALDLVHRDISPQNIMLSDNGILKVVDFGIARAANRYTQTYAGQIKGKITYMSPEQLRGAELDGRSDQHALGTVMWELVSGQNILDNNMSTTDVLDWKLNNKIPKLSGNREDIPIQIDSILAKMTANEPEKRYQTTQEARDALKELLMTYTNLSSEKLGAWVTHLAGERIAKRHEKIAARTAEFARIGEEKPPEPQEPLTLKPTPATPRPPAQNHGKGPQKNMGMAILLGVFLLVALITTGLLYLGGKPKTSSQTPQNPLVRPSQNHGSLVLSTQPGGAQVFLNGQDLGRTPLVQLQVRANHDLNLEFKHEGYRTKTLNLTIQPDEEHALNVTLQAHESPQETTQQPVQTKPKVKPKARAKPKRAKPRNTPSTAPQTFAPSAPQSAQEKGTGFLSIKSEPWTQVYIDGKDYGLTPLYKKKLPVGRYRLNLRNPQSGITHQQMLTISKDKNLKLDLKL